MSGQLVRACDTWLSRWKEAIEEPGYLASLLTSLVFAVVGFFINIYAIEFATERASNRVTDLILSNVPVFDADGLFVYGTVLFALIGVLLIMPHPKRIPFALKTVALFWLIRSIFTSLTHIAPYGTGSSDFGPTINKIFFGADTFFSGHTGMPFLGALAFWRYPPIRYIFLAGTVFFAVVVLLGHLHYSIDVLAALFITYGIFDIAKWLFPKDRKLFYYDLTEEGL